MRSGRLVLGPHVDAFEHELAEATGARHAVGVASGTDAIELALRALALPDGSEVLCPNLAPAAVPTAILRSGHVPVLVDVEPATLTIDPEGAAAAVGPATSAIVAVHLYGRPAQIEALTELGLSVVEDAAQAHGLVVGASRAGSLGVVGCFSFYPTKNLGSFGDGGAVTTSDLDLAGRVRALRTYGEEPRHFARRVGLNSRLDELQAAFLRVRLRRLPEENARRAEIAAAYDAALGRRGVPGVHHLYVVRASRRDELRRFLAGEGVETAVHYPWALSEQPAFAGARRGDRLPVSLAAANEVVSIPCHPYLSPREVKHVTSALTRAATALSPG
jgi:dTDP-3-amino-3,4,6-trideoxy-alpha-D-glucose transaminase